MPVFPQELTKKRLAWLLAGLLILTAVTVYHYRFRDAGPGDLHTYTGDTMGTQYMVKVVATDGVEDSAYAREIQRILDEVDGRMSTYDKDSEVSRFNASRSTEPMSVSPETVEVVAAALKVSEQTDGAFDITLGPVVNAYGFGPEARAEPPSEEELAALSDRVGYEKLAVDTENSSLRKTDPGVYIDLSAIAKGLAVDRIASWLDEQDVENYFVEVGGEVRVRGRNAERQPWLIGIETPVEGAREIWTTIPMEMGALASSGDYRNYYEQDGVRISHTIDGRTGRPIRHNLASVSVFHDECMWADAYATAIMALGPEDGRILAEILGLPVLFLIRHADGTFAQTTTPAFDERFGTIITHETVAP